MGRHKQSAIPKNWPTDSNIMYLTSPVYSRLLSKDQLNATSTSPPTQSQTELSRSTPAEITLINSPIHPAHGQRGLFASQHLPPDAFICFYLGFVHGEADNDPHSDYDLSMDRDAGLGVDATKMGNESRFVNDYRGIRDMGPNAEFRDCWFRLDGKGKMEKRVGVYVMPAGRSGKRVRGIAKGEEILVSYGKGFWCKVRKESEQDLEKGA